MIPFSGLSRFSGHFGGDGPSPLNRDTTVLKYVLVTGFFGRFFRNYHQLKLAKP